MREGEGTLNLLAWGSNTEAPAGGERHGRKKSSNLGELRFPRLLRPSISRQSVVVASLVFGKYERLRRLARGGMGDVFLARHRGLAGIDRLAILKSLREDLAQNPSFREQFLDEARVAALLNHPNIVALYDVGEWEGETFIAMEYIAGEDLAKLWLAAAKRGVGLPFQVSVRIVHDACLGLEHAHRAVDLQQRPLLVVHRDVSPQNIMVRLDGVTKVVDFGIAKAANRVTQTRVGTVKGKLQYMSPEQARGEPLDARSDQFSLGAVLWELCTGTRLFKSETDHEVLEKILVREIPPPSRHVDHFPAALERTIMRMLERERSRRFPDLGAVAAELKAWLDAAERGDEPTVGAFVEEILGAQLRERTRDLTPQATMDDSEPSAPRTSSSSRPPAVGPPSDVTQTDDVTRKLPVAALPPKATPPIWQVYRADGTCLEFQDAARLHQWILDGKLSPDDLLDTGEHDPTPLRGRAELARFFELSSSLQGTSAPQSVPAQTESAWDFSSDGPTVERTGDAAGGAWRYLLAGAALVLTAGGAATWLQSVPANPSTAAAAELAEAETEIAGWQRAIAREPDASLRASLTSPSTRAGNGTIPATIRSLIHAELSRRASVAARVWRRAGGAPDQVEAQHQDAVRERTQAYQALAHVSAEGPAALRHLAAAAYQAEARAKTELEAEWGLAEQALRDAPGAAGQAIRRELTIQQVLFELTSFVDVPDASFDVDGFRARLDELRRKMPDDLRLALASVELACVNPDAALCGPSDAHRSVLQAAAGFAPALAFERWFATRHADAHAASANAVSEDAAPAPQGGDLAGSSVFAQAEAARAAGRCFDAAKLYRKAIKINEFTSRARVGLGWCYLDLSQLDAATRTFERAARLDANAADALFGLAESYRFGGNKSAAVATYQAYLDRFPQGPDAHVAQNALQSLK